MEKSPNCSEILVDCFQNTQKFSIKPRLYDEAPVSVRYSGTVSVNHCMFTQSLYKKTCISIYAHGYCAILDRSCSKFKVSKIS